MNWYKKARKYKDERFEGEKLDTQLLCCGYPENRRKDPYKKNKKAQVNIIENKYIKEFERLMQEDNWIDFGRYIDFLRAQGFDDNRIDYMMNKAGKEFEGRNRKEAGKPRYKGEFQGDEFRPQQEAYEEFVEEISREYKPYIIKMRNIIKAKNWFEFERYKQQLLDEGFKPNVIEKFIVTPAMHRVRLSIT